MRSCDGHITRVSQFILITLSCVTLTWFVTGEAARDRSAVAKFWELFNSESRSGFIRGHVLLHRLNNSLFPHSPSQLFFSFTSASSSSSICCQSRCAKHCIISHFIAALHVESLNVVQVSVVRSIDLPPFWQLKYRIYLGSFSADSLMTCLVHWMVSLLSGSSIDGRPALSKLVLVGTFSYHRSSIFWRRWRIVNACTFRTWRL